MRLAARVHGSLKPILPFSCIIAFSTPVMVYTAT